MRKPAENRLRVLSEVGSRRVRRQGHTWMVRSQSAAAGDARQLDAAREQAWLRLEQQPLDPLHSVAVELTEEGRAVLARYWPNWRPSDEF